MTPFETFYRDHYRSLLGVALALARDTGTAEHLVQEAFISAHRRWDRISQYDNPQAWVRRVLINRATSLRRRLGAKRRAVDRVGPPQPLQPDLSSETEGVWHEVRKLPRRQQQAHGTRSSPPLSPVTFRRCASWRGRGSPRTSEEEMATICPFGKKRAVASWEPC